MQVMSRVNVPESGDAVFCLNKEYLEAAVTCDPSSYRSTTGGSKKDFIPVNRVREIVFTPEKEGGGPNPRNHSQESNCSGKMYTQLYVVTPVYTAVYL